jgi:hypothetical protein
MPHRDLSRRVDCLEVCNRRRIRALSRRVDRLRNELCELWRIQACHFVFLLIALFAEAYPLKFSGKEICLGRVN